MKEVERFGVSIPRDLLTKFDKLIAKKGYNSRSEAIRDLMRDNIVEQAVAEGKEVAGTLTIIYDHHTRDLSDKLNDIQHDHCHNIISTTHIHMDQHSCLEVLVLKGKSKEVQAIADKLISTRGVKHGKLVMTATGKDI